MTDFVKAVNAFGTLDKINARGAALFARAVGALADCNDGRKGAARE